MQHNGYCIEDLIATADAAMIDFVAERRMRRFELLQGGKTEEQDEPLEPATPDTIIGEHEKMTEEEIQEWRLDQLDDAEKEGANGNS